MLRKLRCCAATRAVFQRLGLCDLGARSARSFSFKVKGKKSVQSIYDRQNKQRAHREAFETAAQPIIESEMYTPEILKTDNLTRYCIRLVAYGLHMPELLDRYAERAEELAAQLQPSQFGLILSSFARASHRHDKMLKVFSKRMMPRLPQFVPADISRTCSAYAKLQERDEALFRRMATEMPHKLPLFEGYQLGAVANAYARMDIRDDLLFDDIADEVLRRPHELNHVTLLLVANAFARFKMGHRRLWPVLAEWLLQAHLDFQAQDVGTVLNALSAVDFQHEALVRTLLLVLSEEPLLSEASAATLCLVFNALGRLRRPQSADDEAVQAVAVLSKQASAGLDSLGPPGLMQLLHACARWKPLQSADLTEGILRKVRQRLSEFQAHSLCLLVHSSARLQQRDVALFTQVAKAIVPQLPQFTPQALALTAHGYAKIEVRSEILFYLMAEEIVQKMPLFSGQGVGMTLQSFATLQINNQKLVRACIKHVRALSEELTLHEVDAIEKSLRQLEALDGSTDALLRSLRRKLMMQAAYSPEDDPWEASAESLLQRLSEAGQAGPMQAVSTESGDYSGTSSKHEQPKEQAEPAESLESARESPADLWTMWLRSHEPSDTAEGDSLTSGESETSTGATPRSRLREYLSRPERIGRKTIVVGGEQRADRAGGRKHGRRHEKVS
ncbi:unnamed protein product [Symbiodinium natans]|uniref:RNA-editing substrate-binding complex 8 protein HEAT repeats domain-containing protein n=1 Tax=Symbiodinium natans TaxID=878477 RepID=A0A812R234_9DINO|nr:unnamed protein product [Symbiodinium natans]